MSRRMWLLVEWVDEGTIFPNYGVVNVDSLFNKTEINTGKMIYVPLKHGSGARRAQILRVSDSKRQLKEHKLFLQRQDHQVKNVVSMCMRSIQEMKANPSLYFGSTGQQSVGASSSCTKAELHSQATSDSSSSDEDSEPNLVVDEAALPISQFKPILNHISSYRRLESSLGHRNEFPSPQLSRRAMTSSASTRTNDVKLTFDQGTQTIESGDRPPLSKLNELEDNLKTTYTQYLSLVAQLHALQPNAPHENLMAASDLDHTATEDDTEESDREQNVIVEREELNSNFETEGNGQNIGARTLHVRRVSAHTTNVVETINCGVIADMVSLGAGNVQVPARLLNEINWNSYTTATRQLLQAVFPRRILATHSLSGKQSPAFANRPPKKQLDSNLVEDIVTTVSLRCGVPKRLVRSSITTKCTDEAKLYRNRQHKHARQANQVLEDMENVPPSPVSSPGSFHPTD